MEKLFYTVLVSPLRQRGTLLGRGPSRQGLLSNQCGLSHKPTLTPADPVKAGKNSEALGWGFGNIP